MEIWKCIVFVSVRFVRERLWILWLVKRRLKMLIIKLHLYHFLFLSTTNSSTNIDAGSYSSFINVFINVNDQSIHYKLTYNWEIFAKCSINTNAWQKPICGSKENPLFHMRSFFIFTIVVSFTTLTVNSTLNARGPR